MNDLQFTEESIKDDLRYLQLLAQTYPNIAEASTEIINLEAILNLPKPTEHFISDLHGESEAFNHVLRNASGYIKRKVNEIFGETLTKEEKKELCTLIYYPEQKLRLIKAQQNQSDTFYSTTLVQLIKVCREVSAKYTRSKIRKELPADFAYVIEELLHETPSKGDKKFRYYNVLIDTIIETQRADDFIIALCNLIQRLAIDRLHLLGDIWDRGAGAHLIMDTLCNYHHWDITWGNHDIDWFGAAAGNRACICNVLRLSLRYGNMATLEDGYGINLLPLATFAMETYKNDPCTLFGILEVAGEKQGEDFDEKTKRLIAQMHKAISIIQFKEEARIINRRPEFKMDDRKLLEGINLDRGTCTINGKEYEMCDTYLPTLNPGNPNALTDGEELLMQRLEHSFLTSEKLQRHVDCLLAHGCMYTIANSNLMFHASVPLNADGEVEIRGKRYKGLDLMKKTGHLVREAFSHDVPKERRLFAIDYIWYLWCGKDSPLFDKDKMTTFERYFIKDKATHTEEKGYYYKYNNDEKIIDMILDAFGVTGTHRHIINGHVPVRTLKGETPIKANGKLLVIDGGFSKAYQPKTGIAGYTLTYHSRGLELVALQPFRSSTEAIEQGADIKGVTQIVELSQKRMLVKETDKGRILEAKVADLKKLLFAYRNGYLKEIKN